MSETKNETCNETPIYIVQSVNLEPRRSRVWGFYHEPENAGRCVAENWGDMCELGHYRYGVVSKMPVGALFVPDGEEWWEFRQVGPHDWCGFKIEKPDSEAQVMYGF